MVRIFWPPARGNCKGNVISCHFYSRANAVKERKENQKTAETRDKGEEKVESMDKVKNIDKMNNMEMAEEDMKEDVAENTEEDVVGHVEEGTIDSHD
ncbi:hypothetical protein SKAU_G00337120 [Synaphobranchus kaupii]|uniref:Uncharacterized protein n=1 Tax=Synaphobranchus kaupii TaxID=118154 RepID=A0A9Q1EMD7_SYNKA|nr:hypothetical protein SKAU_G00337120 [Synaphobranchus kaupii]